MGKNRKFIGQFAWPFFRYDVLMPEQIQTDLFEWLYLSLVVQQNEQRGMGNTSYAEEVKSDVRRILKDKFSSIIDEVTIDNIISNAEEEFVVEIVGGNNFGRKMLRENIFSFLDTYEDLFSSKVTVQKVFQDGICGTVVPCFNNERYSDAKNMELSIHSIVSEKPTQTQIQNAYTLYNRLNSLGVKQEEVIDEEEFDPDAEVDYQPDVESNIEIQESNNNTNKMFSVHFIDNSRCEFLLPIGVYSDNDKIIIDTPFDVNTTEVWINKQLKKARSVCSELDKYITDLESLYIPKKEEPQVNEDKYIYTKGVAEQLSVCGDIYRMIEHLPNEYKDLKKLLIEIDKYFVSKHNGYFNSVGKYLECWIHQFVDHSDKNARQYFDYCRYCTEISYVCKNLGVNARPMLNENVFKNWQKAWDHFKADIAGLFVANTKMRSNKKLYYDFVSDLFDLYDNRNNGSHYKPNCTLEYKQDDIEKLRQVTRTLLELI